MQRSIRPGQHPHRQRLTLAMLTINKIIPGGRGLAQALLRQAAFVELDWDVRQRSRFEALDSAGTPLGVFLPRGSVVRGGDVLVAEDGSLRRVRAAPQPVMVVRSGAEHGGALDLLRAAYHLGNRHVALEIGTDHLKLEPDPVLADMLRRRHLTVEETSAAFEPEAGAYLPGAHGAGHAHRHEHGPQRKRTRRASSRRATATPLIGTSRRRRASKRPATAMASSRATTKQADGSTFPPPANRYPVTEVEAAKADQPSGRRRSFRDAASTVAAHCSVWPPRSRTASAALARFAGPADRRIQLLRRTGRRRRKRLCADEIQAAEWLSTSSTSR